QYPDLDTTTRQYMLEELELDVTQGRLYLSPRLSGTGVAAYPALLKLAVESGNDASLAAELRKDGRLNATEQRRKPKGGYTTVAVPVTAADTLAEGEFNRFYARGLCRRAQAEGGGELKVHRAKEVENPRPQSEALIGSTLDPEKLLLDLRGSIGVEPALGLPPGPNSGLSVKIVKILTTRN
ncbi:MAG: hypothetical protein WCF22_03670, partial [Candidatus Sulfotelmatobacter sp.]